MPTLDRITVYPVKSLDGLTLDRATVGTRGALELDREYAIFDADGNYVNGKATAQVHRLRSSFDPATHELTLGVTDADAGTAAGADADEGTATGGDAAPLAGEIPDGGERTFALREAGDREALDEWLSTVFGEPVTLERDDAGGYPDDTELHGPTVISTGTLREVASWFDLPVGNVRRRFRANLELDAETPFWEDRLFADHGEAVAFSLGDVTFLGMNPCQRCVVPSRDPDTGGALSGFRERFVEKRRETRPPWTDSGRFDHAFRLMVNTVVPESEWGSDVAVGATVSVSGTKPAP